MTRGEKNRDAPRRTSAGSGAERDARRQAAEQFAPGKTLESTLARLETQSHFRNVTLALTRVFLKWLARRLRLKAQDAWWNAENRGAAAGWRLRQWGRSRRARAGLRPYRSAAADAGSDHNETPAFDALQWNPLQWRPGAGTEIGALGPVALLPPGVEAGRAVHPDDLLRLRRMHHVEDAQAFHPDAPTRAGTLARLAAAGVVVHIADGGERMRELLGGELHDLLTADARGLDEAERELRSVGMRRAALREHSIQARAWRRSPDGPPLVSILMATKRPELLPQALAAVARQTYPRLELALALHGDDPCPDAERLAAELPCSAVVVRVPASETLGAALNAAVAASSGTLLIKMDDDDAYGPEHVWDLVLARAYSQAQLVGKSGGFTYLSESDCTIRRFAGDAEGRRTFNIAGGSILISRRDLERAGGWRNAPHSVDTLLIIDVLRRGGRAHRTHDAGYMHVRHGGGHTWDVPEALFLEQADVVAPGWNPGMAGLGGLPRPQAPRQDG